MTTKQIYEEYLIPQNLQQHMLRVAALANTLLDHWIGKALDKNPIVQACVFHDIAKPMNFDLAKQAQFGMLPEEITKLAQLQKRLNDNFGNNEHEATVQICKEIGCSSKAVKLVNNLEWSYIPKLLKADDIESLIPIYCDMRIGPKGILPLQQRLADLKAREGSGEHEENAELLEKLLVSKVSADINSITDDQINIYFDKLLDLEVS